MKYLISSLIFIYLVVSATAQPETVGLLYQDHRAAPGYTLIAPLASTQTYLIDNCGEVIHTWQGEGTPFFTCYLLEDGSLLRASQGFIEIIDWQGEQLWRYNTEALGYCHHDIEPLPNGNVLVIASERKTNQEALDRGRIPGTIEDGLEVDGIYEIQPAGPTSGEIVWQWSFWDHLIQDYNPNLEDYGVIAEYPRRINVNFDEYGDPIDWIHLNGIDYNADLDQIIISSRHTSELYIIDHSTTTAEAAGSTGGNAGFGGDFLWRWGNPLVYQSGSPADQKLFQQHNPVWIPEGYPDAGKITVFNNNSVGLGSIPSSIHIVDTQLQSDGSYTFDVNSSQFLPEDHDWSYFGENLEIDFFSMFMSGVQMQPNGNFLVCLSIGGRMIEVNSDGEMVWRYQNPVSTGIFNQYDTPSGFLAVFRAERYAEDYPAFDNKDLTPMGPIENFNLLSESCAQVSSVAAVEKRLFELFPNPVSDILTIQWESQNSGAINWEMFDLNGRQLMQGFHESAGPIEVSVADLASGVYVVRMFDGKVMSSRRLIKK